MSHLGTSRWGGTRKLPRAFPEPGVCSVPSAVSREPFSVRAGFVERMLDLHRQLLKAKTDLGKTALERQIQATDQQIDALVYELYGLTEEEIREETALDSIHSLFPLTREIIKRYGGDCLEFTKIAVVILNQLVRPFTAKWHRDSLAGVFEKPERCAEFRSELALLQEKLSRYTRMLADMAGVEDLSNIEDN